MVYEVNSTRSARIKQNRKATELKKIFCQVPTTQPPKRKFGDCSLRVDEWASEKPKRTWTPSIELDSIFGQDSPMFKTGEFLDLAVSKPSQIEDMWTRIRQGTHSTVHL